jgi:hypothetical protein
MPIHDWTRVDAGLFHDFHQSWTVALRNALNSGGLPPEYFALVEQHLRGPIADVLTLKVSGTGDLPETGVSAISVATAPPRASRVRRHEADIYVEKANRVTVRHRHGDVVAVIEIVSPGNKATRNELRAFVEKSVGLLQQKIHLLVIDLFPPGKRDPHGIHKAIWDEIGEDDPDDLPADKRLTVVSYDAGPPLVAYIESVAVGDALPEPPLFLKPGAYVPAPLEATYQTTWNLFPTALKGLLETPPA